MHFSIFESTITLSNHLFPPHTLKPVQDFRRTSRQKTCPYGHKESDSCLSTSVPLTLHSYIKSGILSLMISPPSARIYKTSRYRGLLAAKAHRAVCLSLTRSGDFRLSSYENCGHSAILPTAKISAFICKIFLLRKSKDSSWSMPLSHGQGGRGPQDTSSAIAGRSRLWEGPE